LPQIREERDASGAINLQGGLWWGGYGRRRDYTTPTARFPSTFSGWEGCGAKNSAVRKGARPCSVLSASVGRRQAARLPLPPGLGRKALLFIEPTPQVDQRHRSQQNGIAELDSGRKFSVANGQRIGITLWKMECLCEAASGFSIGASPSSFSLWSSCRS